MSKEKKVKADSGNKRQALYLPKKLDDQFLAVLKRNGHTKQYVFQQLVEKYVAQNK